MANDATNNATLVTPTGSRTMEQRRTRNSNPCQPCKAAKRRCDLASPRCARCARQDLDCQVLGIRWKGQYAGNPSSIAATSDTRSTSDKPGDRTEPTGFFDAILTSNPAESDFSALHEPLASAFRGWDYESSTMHTSEETQMLDDFLCPSVENPSIASSDQAQMSVSDSYSPQTNTQPVTAGQESKDERRHLWNVYTSQLVHSITAHHSDTANPLIDYLLPRALESSSFRSAILFLAFVTRTKQNGLSSLPYGKQSPAQTSAADAALGAHLENEALSDAALGISQPISMSRGLALEDSSKVTNAYTSLNTLATLVILCTAYIACGNSQSLMVFLEQAFLVAKMLSDELCSNEEYIFLVQYLGFIHTTAMLSPGGYDLKAPDFLTVLSNTDSALKRDFLEANQSAILTPTTSLRDDHFDAHKRSYQLERLAVQKMLRDFQSSCFDDITPTTGISNSVASLMYHVGRLSRLKSSVLNSCLPNEIHWFWGTFESDAEHLELQLGQMLRHRNNQSMIFETFVLKLDQLDDDYKDNHIQHAIDRTRYNDALLHCVRIVFMAKIKNTGARDPRILASTQRILNACSLVNDDSHTAGLLVFPLYTAGLYTDDLEARGFVKQRLISLNNRIVTDTDKLVRNLETCWQNPTGQTTNEQDIDLCILH